MRRTLRLLFLFLITAFLIPSGFADTPTQTAIYGITAHRGNSSDFPQNTIPAFESAINLRIDWAELDVHRTKDGLLVVIHDGNTAKVGDKNLIIAEHTYQELKSVDVAYKFRQQHDLTLAKCPIQAIPLLEDVLALFAKNNITKISIQPKSDCVKAAIDIVRKLNMTDKVGFNDGNLTYMTMVKKLAPEISVFWDRPHNSDIDADIKIAKTNKFEALVINHQGVTADKIRKVKAAGIEVGAWTVNETGVMKKLIQLGIQRIYTDEPQKLMILQKDLETVFCEGRYKQHLQGFCVDKEGNIYWSWTDRLVKTDSQGKILASVPAPSHQGDLCVIDGNVYVAVNLGKFNEAKPLADSWVFQNDMRDLHEIRRIPVPELVYGAGGMAYRNGKFFIVGGLPVGFADNTVYEYDSQFRFQKKHPLNSGYTKMGIQTIAFVNNSWWFGCYGDIAETLQSNENFTLTGRYRMDTSLGIDQAKPGFLLVGNNVRSAMVGHLGYLQQKKVVGK